MQHPPLTIFRAVFLVLALGISGTLILPHTARAQDTPQPSDPAEVVQAFYDWYLDYIGTDEVIQNPLVTQAYHDSAYLTAGFVQRTDELLASFTSGGYDPFLQAQAIPFKIVVGPVEYSDEQQTATVRTYTSFPGQILEVLLNAVDGSWLIDDIARADITSPEDVAGSFYTGYIGYPFAGDEFRNPMLDGIYRASPLVTERMIAQADALITPEEIIIADPFLCAQDIPTGFTVEPARYSGDDTEADVVLRTTFENHAVTVLLVRQDEAWQINDVICGETRTPYGVARLFYDWYLAYKAWNGQGEPLVAEAFRDSNLLTDSFKTQINAHLLDSSMNGGYDLLLCAQDIPAYMQLGSAEITEGEATIRVETSFEGHTFDVRLVQQGDQWRITDVVCQDIRR